MRVVFDSHSRVAELTKGATVIVVTGSLQGVCRDPQDDFVLECAVLGNADAIVTGDKDLLSLVQYEGVRMLSPRQYLDESRTQ